MAKMVGLFWLWGVLLCSGPDVGPPFPLLFHSSHYTMTQPTAATSSTSPQLSSPVSRQSEGHDVLRLHKRKKYALKAW